MDNKTRYKITGYMIGYGNLATRTAVFVQAETKKLAIDMLNGIGFAVREGRAVYPATILPTHDIHAVVTGRVEYDMRRAAKVHDENPANDGR